MDRQKIEENLRLIQIYLDSCKVALTRLDQATAKQCLGAATEFFIVINRAKGVVSEYDRAWVVAEYRRLFEKFHGFPSIRGLIGNHAYFFDRETAAFAQTGRPSARPVESPAPALRDGWSND